MRVHEDTDVAVIGGGLAGTAAAVRAAELGLRVVLLEQGTGDHYPCNSRYSGGIIHVAYRDVKRPRDELLDFVARTTAGEADPALAEAVSDDGRRLVDWLQGLGARFIRFSQLEAHRWCLAPPRTLRPGLDWQGRGPDVTLRILVERLRKLGGRIVLGARATRLRTENGRCTGVFATCDGVEALWPARAVVLADGGFQANRALFVEQIGRNFERVLQRGAATGRGDGLRMAVEAGAALTARRHFYGHVLSREALENDRIWPYPELDAIVMAGIVVGPDGRRLLDEGRGGVAVANELARLDDPAANWVIFDTAIWEGPGRTARIPANPCLEQGGGRVRSAPTLAALAADLGVPAAALEATVAAYNAALDGQRPDGLSPPRSNGDGTACPIRSAPFRALPILPGITYTMGGIAIDGRAQVLRTDGSVIPGLLAAGATTGGLEGGGDVGYVGGLVKAGVFGLRAAESAAAQIGARPPAR